MCWGEKKSDKKNQASKNTQLKEAAIVTPILYGRTSE